MVILLAGPPVVLIAGLATVPGFTAMRVAELDEADDGVGGPGGEEAAETDVDMPRRRGAMVGPPDIAWVKFSEVGGDAAIAVFQTYKWVSAEDGLRWDFRGGMFGPAD